jgi:hypothetical protein
MVSVRGYFKFSDFKVRAHLTDNARRNGMRRLRIKTVIHPDVSPEAVVRIVLASPPTTQTPKNTAQAQASNRSHNAPSLKDFGFATFFASSQKYAITRSTIRKCMFSPKGCLGQGRRGADNTEVPRLLQFLGSLPKVFVNRSPDEFCHRSARLLGEWGQTESSLALKSPIVMSQTSLVKQISETIPSVPDIPDIVPDIRYVPDSPLFGPR